MSERSYKQFIGGRFIEGFSGSFIERRVAGRRRAGSALSATARREDVDLAVEAARTAFDEGPWPHISGLERAEILNRLADLIRDNRDRLVRIEVEEVGKPIRFARGDIDGAVGLTRYAASLAMQMVWLDLHQPGSKQDSAAHARANRGRGFGCAMELSGAHPGAEGALCARRRLYCGAEAF